MTGDDDSRALPPRPAVDPAWLPESAFAALGARRVAVLGAGEVVETVVGEVAQATAAFGGSWSRTTDDGADVVLRVDGTVAEPLGTEGFEVRRTGGTVEIVAGAPTGLLYGFFHLVRAGGAAFGAADGTERHTPSHAIRMLNHWDNMTVHPVMGQVERGYAGQSIFYADGALREDLSRVAEYARLLAASGVNRVSVNNVNVGRLEARLLTDRLDEVTQLAELFRPYGIRLHLSVSFAAPVTVGPLDTADPLDTGVQEWWQEAADRVYAAIPDFGGFVVKADSEGQPGPFAYGRDHADGANMLARALAPHGGLVFWRAFVYNHRQDWRDRSTDRARAAYDHFAPLDGRFDDNVVVQVKYGPIDFQTREAYSPVFSAMPGTRMALELQVTQEYTGQQKHVYYLGEQWSEIHGFRMWGDGGPTLSDVAGGRGPGGRAGAVVAVSNVGDSPYWTGHPLAQANLYAFGRLAWDPELDPADVLDEWITMTYGDDERVRSAHRDVMLGSSRTYERYTAPLGVGFMVTPGYHYGPNVDGYEYSPWGTYHFADRDGVGVDRTRATGTGFTGQYPEPWRSVYEVLADCPDELLLFFHHVPYSHVLHSGKTVIQHIYDTHVDGVEEVEAMRARWAVLEGDVPADRFAAVTSLLDEQLRSATEWRDQVNTYFWRKSGVPDAHGRTIY